MTGDIFAEVSLRDGPTGLYAKWEVARFTNADGTTSTGLGSGNFTAPVIQGTSYTLYISYDSAQNKFTFRFGIEEYTFGPTDLPARVRDPNSPWKALSNRIQINDANSSCYLSGTFDNVSKNGAPYDDFSSSRIDQTKWASYEFAREISGGKLRTKVRSSTGSTSTIHSRPDFIGPSSINIIQAKVTPVQYENAQGAEVIARLAGRFYNDGTPGGGYLGDVAAEVRIGGTGTNPIAIWNVFTYPDYEGTGNVSIASGSFSTPITLGNTYTCFIGWNGRQFTFKFENEVTFYTPTTPINPTHNPGKG